MRPRNPLLSVLVVITFVVFAAACVTDDEDAIAPDEDATERAIDDPEQCESVAVDERQVEGDEAVETSFSSTANCTACSYCYKWCTNLSTGQRCKYGCCESNYTYGPAYCY